MKENQTSSANQSRGLQPGLKNAGLAECVAIRTTE